MTNVIVIRQSDTERSYEAAQDGITAQGETLGMALDRLLAQTGESRTPLLLVRQDQPDGFFSQAEFNRLQALRLRCKESTDALSTDEQSELRELIAREFRAIVERTNCLSNRGDDSTEAMKPPRSGRSAPDFAGFLGNLLP